MPVIMDSAKLAAKQISNMVFASYKNISVHFVIHHEGHISEAMGLSAQEILWHPASATAMNFLQQDKNHKKSTILGIAYTLNKGLFKSSGKRKYLCVCTLNLGGHETLETFKQTAWHQVWHMINRITTFEEHGEPNKQIDRENTNTRSTIDAPKDILTITRHNLCGDIFSCLMSSHDGDIRSIQDIVEARINAVLGKNINANPEYYPFQIAYDGTKTARDMFLQKSWPKKQILPQAMRQTDNLQKVYDDDALKNWIIFAGNTQNMVWRNINKKDLLGVAIHMAGNTHSRIYAHQISELMNITPSSVTGETDFYNSFMTNKMAAKIHNHVSHDLFKKHLVYSLKSKSGAPLREIADKQNENLNNAEINGWCALAMQYAAKAVDLAVKSGHNADQLARKEFEACLAKVTIENLRLLNRLIIQERRKGGSVTMEKIIAICAQHEDLKPVGQSIRMTLEL